MTKQQFLEELRHALRKLPPKDAEGSIDYYSEMIDDRIEAGMSEEQAVADLGTPESAAREILLDLSLPTLIKSKCKRTRAWRAWEIVLLILGAPVWLSLGAAVVATVLSVYVVLWAVIASLWAADAALLACALGGIFAFAVTVVESPLLAVFVLGGGLVCAGVAVFGGFVCLKLSVAIVKVSIKIMKGIKCLLIGKGDRS